ncbi:hypothetical protein TcG_12749 [Trypanosoma cruzi]|nr:hypothetical protein TcG_12749 [Trypanosoma cruzi]
MLYEKFTQFAQHKSAMTLPFSLHSPFIFPMRALQIMPLHCENECLVVVSSRSHPPEWEKEGKSGVRPHGGKRDSTAVSYLTQTLRGQCPVSCADSAMRLWARHFATRIAPSKRNIRRVPSGRTRGGGGIRCLAACCWRRLRRCGVIEDARQERCWAGRAMRSAARHPARPLTAALTHFPPLLSLHSATAQLPAHCPRNNTHVKAS